MGEKEEEEWESEKKEYNIIERETISYIQFHNCFLLQEDYLCNYPN